jgi:serine/threonine protein kinase
MLKANDSVRTTTGRNLTVIKLLSGGGEGYIALVRENGKRAMEVVKIFHPNHTNSERLARTKYLCSLRWQDSCPTLVMPRELISENGLLGYTMDYIPGIELVEFLETESYTFTDLIVILLGIAGALFRLHSGGVAHGDVRQANVLIVPLGVAFHPYLIDFDNFRVNGVPLPPCYGEKMYLAPELYHALNAGQIVRPDIATEKFAFRILAEELLTLRHPSAGYQDTPELFEQAMYGKWVHDPASPPVKGVGGYPSGILNARMAGLFRRGMSHDPVKRPELTEWVGALLAALDEACMCPSCGYPCLADASKIRCPNPACSKPFPILSLVLANGRRFPVDSGCMQMGRNEMGGSKAVSSLHAILRKIGPAVTVENHGRNGTYLKTINGWARIEDRKPIFISAGDVLRFADVEVRVE